MLNISHDSGLFCCVRTLQDYTYVLSFSWRASSGRATAPRIAFRNTI